MILTEIVAHLGGVEFRGDLLSLPVSDKGHDASLIATDFVGLADGSTPLVTEEAVDARRYARRVLERLERHKHELPAEMFFRALSASAAPAMPFSRQPSSTVVTLNVNEDWFSLALLGDCLGVMRTGDDSVIVVGDSRLERFDDAVAVRMAADVSRGLSIKEARMAAHAQLVANRDRANREDSYWLFADDPAAASHITVGSAISSEVVTVCMCTDGFSRLIKPFGVVPNEEELLALAEKRGLAELGARLREVEQAPGSFAEYPRLDPSDDATAILLERVS